MSGAGADAGRARAASILMSARSTSRPIVYLDERSRGAAFAQALVLADRIGEELAVPVFLYGELAGWPYPRTAALRRGRRAGAAHRRGRAARRTSARPACIRAPAPRSSRRARRWSRSTFSSRRPRPSRDARRIAALIREGGAEGLPGLRAIGVQLGGGRRAGLDERRAPLRDSRSRWWSSVCAPMPPSRAPSWSGSRRAPRSPASRRTSPCPASIPPRT